MALLYVPPVEWPKSPVKTYRVIETQQRDLSFEMPFVVGVSDRAFDVQLCEWMRFADLVAPEAQEKASTPADALRVTLQRTGWSFRAIAPALGVEHTQVRRILNREQSPRDSVARRIFDLETLTRELAKTTNGDQQRIRLALETIPSTRNESAITVVNREHNLPRAMMYASEVLFPRTRMAELDPSSLYLDDAIVEIDGA